MQLEQAIFLIKMIITKPREQRMMNGKIKYYFAFILFQQNPFLGFIFISTFCKRTMRASSPFLLLVAYYIMWENIFLFYT